MTRGTGWLFLSAEKRPRGSDAHNPRRAMSCLASPGRRAGIVCCAIPIRHNSARRHQQQAPTSARRASVVRRTVEVVDRLMPNGPFTARPHGQNGAVPVPLLAHRRRRENNLCGSLEGQSPGEPEDDGSRQRKAKRLDPTQSQGLLECGRLLSRGVCGVGGGARRIGKGGSQKAKGGAAAKPVES